VWIGRQRTNPKASRQLTKRAAAVALVMLTVEPKSPSHQQQQSFLVRSSLLWPNNAPLGKRSDSKVARRKPASGKFGHSDGLLTGPFSIAFANGEIRRT
jgi:hypothetical protein